MGLPKIRPVYVLGFLFLVSFGLNIYFASQSYFKGSRLVEYEKTIEHINQQEKEAKKQIIELSAKVDELNSLEDDVKNFYDSISVSVGTDYRVQDSILSAILHRHNLH
jgi:peptidoglycan hydrolase CwlO-like protein